MASKDLVFRFLGVDGGAGREFDRMAGKSAALQHAVGKLTLGFAAAGVAIGVESVKAAAKFQTAMELLHTQAGATQAEVTRMSKAVLALAGPTATAPNELTKGLYHLESAGFRGQKALLALKTAAEGAKIGGANLEDVTNALNATLVSGISGAHNMSKAMGALNATVGAGDMRMQDLAEALGTGVLAAVKGFGLSLNDVGAALATFGDNNIRGADAATQLRMAVLFMAKPAAGAKDALKTLGLTSRSLAKDMGKGGLGLALRDLHDHLVKAGDTGSKMGQAILDLFGKKAGTGISILEQQLGRFELKQKQVATGSKNFASDWTAYTQTFGYSWDRARAAFESMTIQIGTKLLPTATKAMNWIGTTGVADLEKFSGWVSRNKTPIEDIAKVLAAIAAFRFASGALNDVSRVLGIGSRGLGGAGGGILGSAKPIPVYVTNMGGGFGGVGGKGVSGAERAGEGAAAEGVGARIAAKVGLQGAARLAGPLYYTYLATQGGDQAPGQAHRVSGGRTSQGLSDLIRSIIIQPGFDLAKAPGAEKSAYASIYHGGGSGQEPKVNTAAAVAFIQRYGSPAELSALQKLAGAITGVGKSAVSSSALAKAAADREEAAWGGASRTMARQQQRTTNQIIGSLRTLPGAMRQIAREAQAAGLTIGEALDAGVTVGIQQGKNNIDFVSVQVIDGVKHVMSKRAQIGSPSKMTAYVGQMLAAGLALGLRSGKKGVGQAASELMDSVRGGVIGAGSLSNVGSMTDTLGASGGGTSIGDILAFTGGQVATDRAFVRNLAVARKHGLSKSVAQQIAQLGPDQGGSLAASIAGASRGQIHRLNRDEASIGRLGSQIAGTVSLSDVTIAKLGRAIRPVVHQTTPAQLDRHNGKKILSH